jgi:hypothetical protein
MATARAMAALIYDLLAGDACLPAYLDENPLVTHGTGAMCGQPIETHESLPVRREKQGWPGDFCDAIVTFGRFSRSPIGPFGLDRSKEAFTFVVGIYVKSTVDDENGVSSPGDLWALDIYDHVIRILGREKIRLPCPSDLLVAYTEHVGDVRELDWDEERRAWVILTRFRWYVVGRGLRVPAEECCTAT